MKQAIGHPPTLALQVNVASDANIDSVVPFDVVVVRNKSLLKQISQLDAATWFSAKGRCNYRGGAKAKVQFYSWELVPGQTFRLDVPVAADTKAVYGFADYSTAGNHRISLASAGGQFVDMGEDGVHALTTVPVPKTILEMALAAEQPLPQSPGGLSTNTRSQPNSIPRGQLWLWRSLVELGKTQTPLPE
jgi:hypothetical protein